MAWLIEFSDPVEFSASRSRFLETRQANPTPRLSLPPRIANAQDARDFGKPLRHHLAGLWRYRVGDYRILCQIEDERLTVLVVEIAHRGVAYDEPQKHLPRPKPLVEILRFA
jgi:mRNA interferase RelE/StbE